jgi:hypothetical protein
VVHQATAPNGLPGRVHRRFSSCSRGNKCRHRRSFAAFGPLHGDPCAAGAYQPNPASQCRREGTRRRAALRDGKTAAGPSAQLRHICNSGPPGTQAHSPPVAPPSAAPFPAVTAAQPLDFASIAAAQSSCPDVASMRASTALSIVSKPMGEHQLLGDVSTGEFRPLLPPQFRTAAFLSLHNIAHPGIRATCRLVSLRFCWPQRSKQVTTMAQSCLHCQRSKVHKHVHLQPEQIEIPRCRFAHVHVDLVGPLPCSAGFSYLLTVLDRTTRWPEAILLTAVSAADCAAGFFHGWVQRWGLPATITSDRGPQFASSLWSALCSLLNITHLQTTAYHPQANGAVERFHRRLKDALWARAVGADCSASGLLGEKTHHSPQPRQYLEHNQSFQASFSALQNRRRRHSSRSCCEP